MKINYQDYDWPNGYEYHISHLKETILNGGSAIGAFNSNNKLLGFATINCGFFGKKYNYVLLDQLFITLEYRKKGIGTKILESIKEIAKTKGCTDLYLTVNQENENAIKVYEKFGFKVKNIAYIMKL